MKEIPNNVLQCSNPGHCKNHPIASHIRDTLQVQDICIDTVRSADSAINNARKQVTIKEVLKKDCTIQEVDVSLVEPITYVTETVQVVRNQPIQQEPMMLDLPINSFLFAVATVMTVRYVATCSASWSNLIKDLKHEYNKA